MPPRARLWTAKRALTEIVVLLGEGHPIHLSTSVNQRITASAKESTLLAAPLPAVDLTADLGVAPLAEVSDEGGEALSSRRAAQ